ncbi:MAG: Eco57I restriction-modification methylase domain-containing protein [Clostridia bacterium]|nr:Eco57I restriction-modification methylase domain-containing protein [Clostridia bacterium]
MSFNFNKNDAKNHLKELMNRFKNNYEFYNNSKYNESECRLEFIDEFLKDFGWDVQNSNGKSPNLKEVVVESYEQDLGKPDYTMTFNGVSTFFVEAKKPSVNILENIDCSFQARRYGWSAKHKISVLTNFKDLLIYDCSDIPKSDDPTNKNLIAKFNYLEYFDKYDEIYELISKEIVYNGKFEEKFKSFSGIGQTIDEMFLKQINAWRVQLGQELFNIKGGNIEDINIEIQEFINEIVFLRICEDRNLPLYKTLQKSISIDSMLQKELEKIIEIADKRYNSGIFKERNIINELDKTILKNIITDLYYPNSPYDFTVISSNILGEIYEVFISETLIVKNNEVILQPKKENLNRAIVTTPYDVVKFMVSKSLESFTYEKNPDEIKKLRIADIACGSGIFLTEVLDYLINYCQDWYEKNKKYDSLEETYTNTYKLTYKEKREILTNCLYGVDIDYQAVEVAKFSLLLKVLEGETEETVINEKPVLPSLDNNIINGNSLIDLEMLKDATTDELISINPFSFNNINSGNKFDLIIGNPPYVKTEDMIKFQDKKEVQAYKSEYFVAYKQFDKYFLFIQRAVDLVKDTGVVCYIVPNKFINNVSGEKIRELISENNYLKLFIDFNYQQVFKDKTIYSSIIMLNKNKEENFEYCYINSYAEWIINNKSNIYTKIDCNEIDKKPWILSMDIEKMKELKKLFNNSIQLSEIAIPFNGVQTSLNKIYVIKGKEIISEDEDYVIIKKNNKEYKIERSIVKRYFQPINNVEKNVNSFDPLVTDKYIIFPYDERGKLIDINLQQYKGIKEYLLDNYDLIVPKQVSGKSTGRDVPNSNKSNWYQFGRVQAINEFNNQEKLIVGVMSKEPMFMYDNENLVIQSGGTAGYCGIKMKQNSKYDLFFLQSYLSHPIMNDVMEKMGSDFEGGFYSRGTQVLEKLPIIDVDFDNTQEKNLYDKIVNNTRKIYDLNKTLKSKIMKKTEEEAIISLRKQIVIEIMKDITKLIELKDE